MPTLLLENVKVLQIIDKYCSELMMLATAEYLVKLKESCRKNDTMG
ncbi:MAG: hypothetical protein L3J18_07325 [Candidatus Brocadia sp.]|nr:MAG: hypothetical protein L3J18_07325 [Candidatus Brocadia sp.]